MDEPSFQFKNYYVTVEIDMSKPEGYYMQKWIEELKEYENFDLEQHVLWYGRVCHPRKFGVPNG